MLVGLHCHKEVQHIERRMLSLHEASVQGCESSSTHASKSKVHSQKRRMLSPKTFIYGVFDHGFDFDSHEGSCSEKIESSGDGMEKRL